MLLLAETGCTNMPHLLCLIFGTFSAFAEIHRESKKTRHQLHQLLAGFQKFFTSGLGSKFATNSCLNIPPRFQHVATLLCEIWMSEIHIAINGESQGSIAKNLSLVSYFSTHLSFTLLVKEFLRLVNIWQSYRQNGWLCHTPHWPCTFVLKDAHFVI